MRATVGAADLLAIAKIVRKGGRSIGNTVGFVPAGGTDLDLVATLSSAATRIRLSGVGWYDDRPDPVDLTDLDRIEPFLADAAKQGGAVTVERAEGAPALTLSLASGVRLNLACESADPFVMPAVVHAVEPGALLPALKRAAAWASKDESRPNLRGPHLYFNGEGLLVCATDGHRAVVLRTSGSATTANFAAALPGVPRRLIPNGAVAAILAVHRHAKGADPTVGWVDDPDRRASVVAGDRWTAVVTPEEGARDLPDIWRVVPPALIGPDGPALVVNLKALQALPHHPLPRQFGGGRSRGTAYVVVLLAEHGVLSAAEIGGEHNVREGFTAIGTWTAPVAWEPAGEKNFVGVFDRRYLEALKPMLAANEVNGRFLDSLTPALFAGADGMGLVMPIRHDGQWIDDIARAAWRHYCDKEE